ncbi:MAG: MarR family winged helix-turn-helix transcriptional regulator [Actinomycetota bacterium]
MDDDDRLVAYRLLIADVYELAGSSRRSSERLANLVGQTAARWHVMSVVSEQPFTVPAVARRLGLTRQGVQRVVHDLVDAGLARLEPNPDHARSPLVSLAPDGRRVLADLFARSEESRRELLDRAGVTADDLTEARRVIRAVAASFAGA